MSWRQWLIAIKGLKPAKKQVEYNRILQVVRDTLPEVTKLEQEKLAWALNTAFNELQFDFKGLSQFSRVDDSILVDEKSTAGSTGIV